MFAIVAGLALQGIRRCPSDSSVGMNTRRSAASRLLARNGGGKAFAVGPFCCRPAHRQTGHPMRRTAAAGLRTARRCRCRCCTEIAGMHDKVDVFVVDRLQHRRQRAPLLLSPYGVSPINTTRQLSAPAAVLSAQSNSAASHPRQSQFQRIERVSALARRQRIRVDPLQGGQRRCCAGSGGPAPASRRWQRDRAAAD